MNILLFTDSEYLYEYQLIALKEFTNDNEDVHFSLFRHRDCATKHHLSAIIGKIDKRFSNYPLSSLKETHFNDTSLKIKLVHDLPSSQNIENVLLLNGVNGTCRLLEELRDFTVFTFQYSEENVFSNCLKKNDSVLSIITSPKGEINCYEIFKLKLGHELGIYNSRDKFLFYSGLYLGRCLKNNIAADSKKQSFEPLKIKRLLLPILVYYSLLVMKFALRKISPYEFNWRIKLIREEQEYILNQPNNTFWADPFLIKKGKYHYVFFEELVNHKGEISVIKVDSELNFISKESALIEDHHLSFPNIFEQNDRVYMLPESSAGNNLSIYECIDFPTKWVKKIELFSGKKLVDAVWIFHDNLYWIFANVINDFEYGNNEHLHVFYSHELLSNDWKPHPANPVITDIEKSRNAGLIRNDDGKLVRVSQNCKRIYGENLVFNEILCLTTSKYEEKTIRSELPAKEFYGMHTYNSCDEITVVDLLKKERKAD